VIPLDFTGINPDVVDRLLAALPECDRTRTTYAYCGQDTFSVVATIRHTLDGGIQVRVQSIGSLDEIDDADLASVDGLSRDEIDNYRARRAEA
jgi:hypothetical protein